MKQKSGDVQFVNDDTLDREDEYYYSFLKANANLFSRRSNGKEYAFGFTDFAKVLLGGNQYIRIEGYSSRVNMPSAGTALIIRQPRKMRFYFDRFNVRVQFDDLTGLAESKELPTGISRKTKTRSRRGELYSNIDNKLTLAWRRYNQKVDPTYSAKLKEYLDECAKANKEL